MSIKSQQPLNQDFVVQASVAAELTNALASVAVNGHQGQTQISIENAIQSLLAPLQPDSETGTMGNGQATAGPKDDNVYIHFVGATATGKTNLAFRVQSALLDQGFNVNLGESPTGDVLTVVNPVEVIKAGDDDSTKPDPRLDPNWCEDCQEVHTPPGKYVGELAGLLTILSLLGGRKPKA